MTYPIDLDEQDEHRLRAELIRREELRKRGLCDYCERPPASPSCKFPLRHNAKLIQRTIKQ